jgi:hypothetical protein
MDGRRAPRDMQADVKRARQILATALLLKSPGQVADDAAIMVAAGAWWIEDLLAKPTTARLLRPLGRKLLKQLNAGPDGSLNPAFRTFRDKLADFLDAAGFERLPRDTDPCRRLLLGLLSVVWTWATGRDITGGDRDDGPLQRFLEGMVNPKTGLPGLSRTSAARSACYLSPRMMLREVKRPRQR